MGENAAVGADVDHDISPLDQRVDQAVGELSAPESEPPVHGVGQPRAVVSCYANGGGDWSTSNLFPGGLAPLGDIASVIDFASPPRPRGFSDVKEPHTDRA